MSAFLRGRPAAREVIKPWIVDREAAASRLRYGDVIKYRVGLPNARRQRAQIRRLIWVVDRYPVSPASLNRSALVRRQLWSPHGSGLIRDSDTLIAATAMDMNPIVVVTDADFHRVPALRVHPVGSFRS